MGEASTSGPPKPARHESAAKLTIQRIKLDVKYSKHGIKESNGDKKGSRQSRAASLGRSGLIVTGLELVEVWWAQGSSVRQFNPVFKRKQTDGSPRMTALTFQSLRNRKRRGGDFWTQLRDLSHTSPPALSAIYNICLEISFILICKHNDFNTKNKQN